MSGKVVLVGAGPSNEDLLTIGGKNEILKADVVVYDRLVSQDILDLIPKDAEKINVGKTSGNHPVKQDEINKILLEKALEEKYVVRLKGGDGFLFGRGAEELELLKLNNIDYKVIPGISSSLSAPTYAGIPVTHRDFSSSVHIITGHLKENNELNLDFEALVRVEGTLVFLMSIATCGKIADGLIQAKMPKKMPVAVIENGTSSKQRKILTTLENLQEDILQEKIISPAIILVGKVCELDFDWYTRMPLFSKNILITRPRKEAIKLSEKLREFGANAVISSTIDIEYTDFLIPKLEKYSWVFFTSPNAVKGFFQKIYSTGIDSRCFFDKKIAVIGKMTEKELLNYGIIADFIPNKSSSENLALEILEKNLIKSNDKILILRGNLSAENLQKNFKNIDFDEIICYETKYIKENSLNLQEFDSVTFTSASTVNSFVESYDDFNHLMAFCIGEMTQKQAEKYGFKTKTANNPTIDSLIECIKEYYND